MSYDPFQPFSIIIEALFEELDDAALDRALDRATRLLDVYEVHCAEQQELDAVTTELLAEEDRPGVSIENEEQIRELLDLPPQ